MCVYAYSRPSATATTVTTATIVAAKTNHINHKAIKQSHNTKPDKLANCPFNLPKNNRINTFLKKMCIIENQNKCNNQTVNFEVSPADIVANK